jgi:hypothetical protein
MEQSTELIRINNVKGSKTLSYLRGEVRANSEQKEVNHTIVFFGKRVERIKKIVELLVKDARQPLTEISRRTGIPVSTVYDNIKRLKEQFRFTIIPKEIYYDEDKVLFEVAQTNMQDFKLPKAG